MPNVYIFNQSGAAIVNVTINSINVASVAATPLAGWNTVPATPYSALAVAIPRSAYPANLNPVPAFSQSPGAGANLVHVAWANNNFVTFTVDPSLLESQILMDYVLYIAPKQAILFDQFGTKIQEYPTTPAALTAAAPQK
jgi:hypothetical protein